MRRNTHKTGFTLVELMVTIIIFSLLSGVVLSNYRNYDSHAIFANATEDVALALRQAQVYGVGAKGNVATVCGGVSSFDCHYGVQFMTTVPNNKITVFADVNDNQIFDAGDTAVETITWKDTIRTISLSCGGLPCTGGKLNVTFRRPNPSAWIADVASGGSPYTYNFAQVVLSDGTNFSTTTISKAGQIAVD